MLHSSGSRIGAAGLAVLAIAALVTGCASTGPESPNAKPVLYPNAALTRMGESTARTEAEHCMGRARSAGLTPEDKSNSAVRSAEKGAAVTGVAAAVGVLVTGRGIEGAAKAGLGGAAIGGSAGAVAGAVQERPNTTYRRFVERCLQEKGLEVIGWN
jgi:hypothetical protein